MPDGRVFLCYQRALQVAMALPGACSHGARCPLSFHRSPLVTLSVTLSGASPTAVHCDTLWAADPIPRKTLNRRYQRQHRWCAKAIKILNFCARNQETRRPLVGRQGYSSGASFRAIPSGLPGALAVQEFRIEVETSQEDGSRGYRRHSCVSAGKGGSPRVVQLIPGAMGLRSRTGRVAQRKGMVSVPARLMLLRPGSADLPLDFTADLVSHLLGEIPVHIGGRGTARGRRGWRYLMNRKHG